MNKDELESVNADQEVWEVEWEEEEEEKEEEEDEIKSIQKYVKRG